jgi:glycine cleavage system transcriptional repressor
MADAKKHLALSALGPDRPGLVEDVTRYLVERGGNLEEGRMAVLGGQFGVMLLVSAPTERLAELTRDKPTLEARTGLTVTMHPTVSPAEHRAATVIPCRIVASALDQEGIVHAISKALHTTGINIVSLETTAYHAPVTGSPLFKLEVSVDVPRNVPVTQVRAAMDVLATTYGLDVEVRSLVS